MLAIPLDSSIRREESRTNEFPYHVRRFIFVVQKCINAAGFGKFIAFICCYVIVIILVTYPWYFCEAVWHGHRARQ